MCGLSYSRLMQGLAQAEIEIDRKMLADLAMNEFDTFAQLADQAKARLSASS
ncbi:MAG: 50S ribosomal protein L20, partial [Gammaproteobacteria bacterium]|nr:50S ribosomal protein L20 [Gammaproteobacteria bacterium]